MICQLAPGRRRLREHALERILTSSATVAPWCHVTPFRAEDDRRVIDDLPGFGQVAHDVHLGVAAQEGRVDVLGDHPAVGGRGLLGVEAGRAHVGGDDERAPALRGLRGGGTSGGAASPTAWRPCFEEGAPGLAGLEMIGGAVRCHLQLQR
jgi:hypothetical protein